MLIPRRTAHRKQHRPDRHGNAKGGTRVAFGEYGIQALERSYVTNRQIEAARIAMTRHIRRGGKVWITIYPDRPLTKKPAETRMGSGKGAPEWWVANVKPGRVMFELSGVKPSSSFLTRKICWASSNVILVMKLPLLGIRVTRPARSNSKSASLTAEIGRAHV